MDVALCGVWRCLTGYYNVGLVVGRYVCVCYCVCFLVGVYVVRLGLLRAGWVRCRGC